MDAFWQAVEQHDWTKPETPLEFRVYYDKQGDIICYSMENLPGNYVVTDQQTFNQFRMDLKVRDGKLVRVNRNPTWKMIECDIANYACHSQDVTIIVPDAHLDKKYWKVKTTHEES